jgi:hypothetical protein
MSAYLCNPTHMAALAVNLYPQDNTKAAKAARLLIKENIKSVMYRYDDLATPQKACREFLSLTPREYLDRTVALIQDPTFHANALLIPSRRVLGLIHCLDYQSCEHAEWKTSTALALLKRLTAQLGYTEQSEYTGWKLDAQELTALSA